jgi:hypothetical protein
MLLIEKSISNTLIFTLTERSQLAVPYFLFEFVSDTGVTKLFNMTDNSGYPRRFNEMTLIETTTEDLSLGEVDLNYGWGTYTVYESTTQTLLVANTTGRILEEGKYFVKGYPATQQGNNSTSIYL